MSKNDDANSQVDDGQGAEPDTQNQGTDLQADVDKWKALARKHEARAKENADKATKFDELAEQQKTEQQKLQEQAEQATRRAAEAEQARWRAEIAAEKGLTLKQASRLVGTTRDELESDADELLTDFGITRRVKDFGGGDRGSDVTGGVKQFSHSDIEGKSNAEINQARREGKLDRLMGKSS